MNAVKTKHQASAADLSWTEQLRGTLARYDEKLLRQVAGRLLRLRSQANADELIERISASVSNAALIDRRLRDLDETHRSLLALIGMSRQPRWRLGALLELLSCFEVSDGMAVVFQLFEAGLLYPELPSQKRRLKTFEEWLGLGTATEFRVFCHPAVTARALRHEPSLLGEQEDRFATCPPGEVGEVREADGLDLLLRLAVLSQMLPLRLTQQGEFFKRDQERLGSDPLLAGPAADELATIPDRGHLLISFGLALGVFEHREGEVVAGRLPNSWSEGLLPALTELWATLPDITCWNITNGWRGLAAGAGPFASAGLLAIALLSRLPQGHWTAPGAVAAWLTRHHCYWNSLPSSSPPRSGLETWAEHFLLGLACQLRLVQAAQDSTGRWVVRLSAWGSAVLGLRAAPTPPAYAKTLMVQPNLEIVAYRQGLTPQLIADLSGFCTWKSLGSACTLQLQPEAVYRGLEGGADLEQILHTLQQHAVRDLPASVVQSLKTWAGKRERLAVYPSALLLEFQGEEDLQAALARGITGLRISERLLLVARESDIDFTHFRLLATRDYSLPPEPCVEVESDGVTLMVDLARADLMLETEIQRFAEPVPANGRRQYQLTPAALARSRDRGVTLRTLEEWFLQRTGRPVTPAVRLLLAGNLVGAWSETTPQQPLTVQRLIVLQVPSPVLADGLMQWPPTRALIQARLGPQALAIEESNLEALRTKVEELQLPFRIEL